MKKVLFAVVHVLAFLGCTGYGGSGPVTDADSLYTYDYIFLHHIQEPERCLALLDTSEMRGVMSLDSCNWLRGHIYNACLKDYAHANEYLHRVLDRPGLSHASDIYLTALSTYCTFSLRTCEYAHVLEHATEGARLAREAGNARFEAEFYGVAGAAIEHKRPGAGIDYLDRAIALIRQQNDRQLLPKASFYMSEKARIQIEQSQYAKATATCRERLALIDEMQQLGVVVSDGYFDVQLARTYAKLAMCLQSLGQTAEARQTADAFDKTDFSKTISGMHDIMHYYVTTDDRQRVEQLCNELENYYQQGDTINEIFRAVLLEKAKWYRHHGMWHEADKASVRATALFDSLIVRDRNHQVAEYEVRFKTQEKEMELAEANARTRLHGIIICALIAIIVVGTVAFWRIIVAKRLLHQKNKDLFELVEEQTQTHPLPSLSPDSIPEGRGVDTSATESSLFVRLCTLMNEKHPYTNSDLRREDLAQMLGTNFVYLADAIRECTGGQTLSDFLDEYRIRHAARLLANTDDPIGLVTEMSGFASRSHFNSLFREKYKMTPSEYRKVAKENSHTS